MSERDLSNGQRFMAALAAHAVRNEGRVTIGVIGTRNLDQRGRWAIDQLLNALAQIAHEDGLVVEIVQGGCRGADQYAAELAARHGFLVHTILPDDMSQVPVNWTAWTDTHEQGGPYRERNKKIVQRAGLLFVVADYPEDHGKSKRSGTWMTCRMAREAMKPCWETIQHETD